MATSKVKVTPTVTIPSAAVPASEPELVVPAKSDPNYFKIIGKISAAKRRNSADYSSKMAAMAALSHGPASRRDGYHGGRKKKGQPS